MAARTKIRIGVIADTHGTLHPRIPELFRGVDHIVHAGDIGGESILEQLRELAPVTYVEGNNDTRAGYDVARVTVAGLRILVTHILPRPSRPGRHVRESLATEPADVVVFGHSHLPHDEERDGIVYFNPASAGPRRFDLPRSAAMFELDRGIWRRWHIALDDRSVEGLKVRMNQMR